MLENQELTRKLIEATYDTKDGVIVSPGKFEGEVIWVPYAYQQLNTNGVDEALDWPDQSVTQLIFIGEDEIKEWPELKEGLVMALAEDEEGFVHGKIWSKETYDQEFKRNLDAWDKAEEHAQAQGEEE